MELQTISQVSRRLGISTRTLRYYEQIGLIRPAKKEDFAYRAYDESTVLRLRQIIVLRKLRLPLRQIAEILRGGDTAAAIAAFERSLGEIGDEIAALSVIRRATQLLLERLRLQSGALPLLDDESLLEMADSLTVPTTKIKEETTMEELNQAGERLSKLADRDVRIVYLPPADVAAYQFEGDEPERHVGEVVNQFVLDNDLARTKPDLRHYGFNAPNPVDGKNAHGYEMWVTIPDGMDVPAPLVKKRFPGGLYAAHMIPMGAFEEWGWLNAWVQQSGKYEYRGRWDGANMFGWLEESLNYVNRVHLQNPEGDDFQLDLLLPIKERGE